MEQRTCNIIRCCKGHCKLDGADGTPMGNIAAYMSHECGCPIEDYKGKVMESILREALFDYFASADKPGFELRQLLESYATYDPSLSERMVTVFQLAKVCDNNGYVNGFTDELMDQSKIDLGEMPSILKLIPMRDREKYYCHFCGEKRSVKYLLEVPSVILNNKPYNVACCNKCVLFVNNTVNINTGA